VGAGRSEGKGGKEVERRGKKKKRTALEALGRNGRRGAFPRGGEEGRVEKANFLRREKKDRRADDRRGKREKGKRRTA